ncbi:MAG: hypothetical protein GEU76_01165 [Alphaproteobacteria bacterium]|nr:hypothetical protein [Alphaproteobacteria bacterium]
MVRRLNPDSDPDPDPDSGSDATAENLDGPALTIAEFCRRNGRISRSAFYAIRNAGKAPKIMRCSANRIAITRRAEAAWRKEREKKYENRS